MRATMGTWNAKFDQVPSSDVDCANSDMVDSSNHVSANDKSQEWDDVVKLKNKVQSLPLLQNNHTPVATINGNICNGTMSLSNGRTPSTTEEVTLLSAISTSGDGGDPRKSISGEGNISVGYSDLSPSGVSVDDEEEEDLKCGLGPFSPRWLQPYASKQMFLATFCLTCVLQGMFYTYFVSVITTIEKLFQIQSKTTGIIMSATEIGQIGSSLLLTYYGGQGHRPKWIGWGMVLFAASSILCSLPHFIFGKLLLRPDHGGSDIPPSLCQMAHALAQVEVLIGFSEPAIPSQNFFDDPYTNMTTMSPALNMNLLSTSARVGVDLCEKTDAHNRITTIVLTIFFISLLGVGMGQTAVYTLGIPYIDDNVASRESPVYFAITIGVRVLGPVLGFLLGSLCTRIYVDLVPDSGLTPSDPRWIGAWWLGQVLVTSLMMIACFAMFSFPRRLPVKKRDSRAPSMPRPVRRDMPKPMLKDFPAAVKRLLKNDILMFRTASSVLHILPIAGLYTFLPKYLESQFRLVAHNANLISGVGGILVMGVGIMLSGIFIRKVKPSARFVAGWVACTAILYAIGMAILMFLGCPQDDFVNNLYQADDGTSVAKSCNSSCLCDDVKYSPICGSDGMTYISGCHAGCKSLVSNKTVKFSECDCIGGDQTAKLGYCSLQCPNFLWYIFLFSFFVLIHSTGEVGSMLLTLRCVDPRDKAMALGLIQFAIGLFGNVPCPIVYGAVVDYACLVWDKTCGELGACNLYDAGIFRRFFHGTTGMMMIGAFFIDLIVWYKAGSISFVEDSSPNAEDESSPMTLKTQYETSV